jgi:hypothetical protein
MFLPKELSKDDKQSRYADQMIYNSSKYSFAKDGGNYIVIKDADYTPT